MGMSYVTRYWSDHLFMLLTCMYKAYPIQEILILLYVIHHTAYFHTNYPLLHSYSNILYLEFYKLGGSSSQLSMPFQILFCIHHLIVFYKLYCCYFFLMHQMNISTYIHFFWDFSQLLFCLDSCIYNSIKTFFMGNNHS